MSAPDRIWTASTYGKCHVGFDTPSMNYTNEYIRKDASDAAIAAARAEGVREGMLKAAEVVEAQGKWMQGHNLVGNGFDLIQQGKAIRAEAALTKIARLGQEWDADTPTEYERKVAQMKEDFPNGI